MLIVYYYSQLPSINRMKRTSVVETCNLLHFGQFLHVRWIEEERWKVRNETCQE